MIAAGIGCRAGCPAEAVVALVAEAGRRHRIGALAAPAWKRGEAGLAEAAAALGLELVWMEEEALRAVQGQCRTRSAAALRAVGLASVAEAAALAAAGPPLLLPRFGRGAATCAVAGR